MLDDENHLVTQFLTLWAMLDPISHLPLFLAATVDLSGQEKRRAAVLGVVASLAMAGWVGIGEALTGKVPNMPAVATDQADGPLGNRLLIMSSEAGMPLPETSPSTMATRPLG